MRAGNITRKARHCHVFHVAMEDGSEEPVVADVEVRGGVPYDSLTGLGHVQINISTRWDVGGLEAGHELIWNGLAYKVTKEPVYIDETQTWGLEAQAYAAEEPNAVFARH